VLRLTWGGRERGAAPRPNATRTHCQRVVFGGVAFELLADPSGEGSALSAELRRHAIEGRDPRAVADVVCAVHRDPALLREEPRVGREPTNVVRFCTTPDAECVVRAPGLHAELAPIGPRRYALTARVAPGDEGLQALMLGVSAAILHREGGVLLHAAAAELDGRAVLFVGPSGAGKSTAVRHTREARCFAYDHVALVPTAAGWVAWGLPGGSAVDAPLAPEPAYPLAAVLRVRRALSGTPQVTRLFGAQALFALRESVEWADDSPGGEDVYLRAVMELSSQVTVGSIATVLGSANDSALRELLSGGARGGLPS
jgi:hypothetical protein